MQTIMFILSLVIIMMPIVMVIGGLSPKAENTIDRGMDRIRQNEWLIPVGIWSANLICFVMVAGLALGKYGFKILH